MIKAKFSTLMIVPYTEQELKQIPKDELRKANISNYKIVEEQILSHDFINISDIKQKTIELCNKYESQPIILVMPNYLLSDSFITGVKYKHDDPTAIFECIVSKRENGKIKELFRMLGNQINSTFLSAYREQHKLPQKLYIVTNIIYDEITSIFNGIYDTNKLESDLVKFDKILENDPSDYNALLCKGWILSELGRYDEAISFYDKILKVLPGHHRASTFKEQALQARRNPV